MTDETDESTHGMTVRSGPHVLPTEPPEAVTLPTAQLTQDPTSPGEFQLLETLGLGGMGQVLSATQRSLQRPVAVKFAREASGRELLLREAIATGRLEHPNIVPVHLLATTPDGVPFFAMKRVEGTPWSDALAQQRPLVEHLEVFQRVCDAVAFAHDRKVVHRDIKPANVLMGAFGEVYLVDWGLAVSLRPDSVLPLASDGGFGGTPSYMAPEMVDGRAPLGPWTDVYLLGATLYEVLMGHPPHLGASAVEAMRAATSGVLPHLDERVPSELASICRKALAPRPQDRHASVLELKKGVTNYLRHREAMDLYDSAVRQLAVIERQLTGPVDLQQSVHGTSIHALFTECRFGFEQVRRLWPEFDGARANLRRVLVLMARSELQRGSPRAARLIMAQLDAPPSDLVREVELAEQEERARQQRLQSLEQHARETSSEVAGRQRATYARIFAVVVLVGSVALQWVETSSPGTLTPLVGLAVSVAAALNSFVYRAFLRRTADVNRMQLRVATGLLISNSATALLWLMGWAEGLSTLTCLRLFFLLLAATWAAGAVLAERRGLLVAGACLASLAGTWLFPGWAFAWGGLCGAVGFVLLARSLARASRRLEADPDSGVFDA